MKINNHIQNLKQKHQDLQKVVDTELLYFRDNTRITELKKQKLQLKDKITRLYRAHLAV